MNNKNLRDGKWMVRFRFHHTCKAVDLANEIGVKIDFDSCILFSQKRNGEGIGRIEFGDKFHSILLPFYEEEIIEAAEENGFLFRYKS